MSLAAAAGGRLAWWRWSHGATAQAETMKNPGVAAVLSFLLTGLGQIYNGQILKGLILMGIQLINGALMLILVGYVTFAIVWLYGIVDAYSVAKRHNAGEFRL